MSFLHRLPIIASCLCAFALSGATAHAQDLPSYPACAGKPSPDDVAAAKGAHEAAKGFNKKANYELAIQQWRLAYGFDCSAHRLLINIGNAHVKLEQLTLAIHAFELYIQRDTKRDARTASTRRSIQKKIDEIKTQLKKNNSVDLPASAMAPLASDAKPQGSSSDAPPPADDDSESSGSIAPWLLIGGGSAAAIGGGVLIGVAMSKFSEADELCPGTVDENGDIPCPENKILIANSLTTKGRTFNGAGIATLSVGVLAIGGGILLYATQDETSDAKTSSNYRITPLLAPGFGGLGLSGRF